MERTTPWTSVGVNAERGEGSTAVGAREEGGEMVKLPDKGRMWKGRWLSLPRRGDERWILLLFAFWFFFVCFFPSQCFSSCTPSVSLCCLYMRPSGLQQSASQLVFSARAAHDFLWLLLLFVPQFAPPAGSMCSWCVVGRGEENRAKISESGLQRSSPVFPRVDERFSFRIHDNAS